MPNQYGLFQVLCIPTASGVFDDWPITLHLIAEPTPARGAIWWLILIAAPISSAYFPQTTIASCGFFGFRKACPQSSTGGISTETFHYKRQAAFLLPRGIQRISLSLSHKRGVFPGRNPIQHWSRPEKKEAVETAAEALTGGYFSQSRRPCSLLKQRCPILDPISGS